MSRSGVKGGAESITHDSLEPAKERTKVSDLSLSMTYTESFSLFLPSSSFFCLQCF